MLQPLVPPQSVLLGRWRTNDNHVDEIRLVYITNVANRHFAAECYKHNTHFHTVIKISATFLQINNVDFLRRCRRVFEVAFTPILIYAQGQTVPVQVNFRRESRVEVFQPEGTGSLDFFEEASVEQLVRIYHHSKDTNIRKKCEEKFYAILDERFSAFEMKKSYSKKILLLYIDNPHFTIDVFNKLLEAINDYLISPEIVVTFAKAIEITNPIHLQAHHLRTILGIVFNRFTEIFNKHESSHDIDRFLLNALARVLNAIADSNVKIPSELKPEIKKNLDKINSIISPMRSCHVKSYLHYAQKALQRVRDDEPHLAKIFRIATGVVKGVWCFYAAFNRFDPGYLVEGFFTLDKSARHFFDFAKTVKANLTEAYGLVHGGMAQLEQIGEIFNQFKSQKGWFEQLRYLEWLIASNSFRDVEMFLTDTRLVTDELDFLYLAIDRLHEVILTHSHLRVRKQMIRLLSDLYQSNLWFEKLKSQDLNPKNITSLPVAIKATIISYLQSYYNENLAELKGTVDAAFCRMNSRHQESNFIEYYRKNNVPHITANNILPIEVIDQMDNQHLSLIEEVSPEVANMIPETGAHLPITYTSPTTPLQVAEVGLASPSASYLKPAAGNPFSHYPIPDPYHSQHSTSPGQRPQEVFDLFAQPVPSPVVPSLHQLSQTAYVPPAAVMPMTQNVYQSQYSPQPSAHQTSYQYPPGPVSNVISPPWARPTQPPYPHAQPQVFLVGNAYTSAPPAAAGLPMYAAPPAHPLNQDNLSARQNCIELWNGHFGRVNDRDVPSLPDHLNELLESPCPFSRFKRIKDTHRLVLILNTINGNNINFEKIQQIINKSKKIRVNYADSLKDIKNFLKDYGKKEVNSYWMLITNDLCWTPDLNNLYKGYTLPDLLEITISLFFEYQSGQTNTTRQGGLVKVENKVLRVSTLVNIAHNMRDCIHITKNERGGEFRLVRKL